MNLDPDQLACETFDCAFLRRGWAILNAHNYNLALAIGILVSKYQIEVSSAESKFFVQNKPVEIIEFKRKNEEERLTAHGKQSGNYHKAKLIYRNNSNPPLPFFCKSTGSVMDFTDYQNQKPKYCSRFSFHGPRTFWELMAQKKQRRARTQTITSLLKIVLGYSGPTAIYNLEKLFKAKVI